MTSHTAGKRPRHDDAEEGSTTRLVAGANRVGHVGRRLMLLPYVTKNWTGTTNRRRSSRISSGMGGRGCARFNMASAASSSRGYPELS